MVLTNTNTYAGGTTVSGGGLINFNAASNFGSGNITLNGGGLQWATGNTADISGMLNPIGSGGATFDTNGNNVPFFSALSGAGGLTKVGNGILFPGNDTYAGPTNVKGGVLDIFGAASQSLAFNVNNAQLVIASTGSINPNAAVSLTNGQFSASPASLQIGSLAGDPPPPQSIWGAGARWLSAATIAAARSLRAAHEILVARDPQGRQDR